METTKKEYEEKITKAIAHTFGFKQIGKQNQWFKCQFCNKRFNKSYVGKPVNERMIDHAKIHHIGVD